MTDKELIKEFWVLPLSTAEELESWLFSAFERVRKEERERIKNNMEYIHCINENHIKTGRWHLDMSILNSLSQNTEDYCSHCFYTGEKCTHEEEVR